jgi:hypothetical protein
MKLSPKSNYILSTSFLILFSFLYIFLIKIGFEKQNIDLKNTEKVISIVEDCGIDFHRSSKGQKSDVFYIKLKDLDEKIGVYRFSKKYDELLNSIKKNDTITAYYIGKLNGRENVNIDLVQIEKNKKVLLEKSEYEKKEGSLIYIGFGALIAHGIILYYSRKKYLKTIKKTKASANSRLAQ